MNIHGRHYLTGDVYDVQMADGVVQAIDPAGDGTTDIWLAPGLIDIQVNGYRGYSFSCIPGAPDVTAEEVVQAAQALTDAGVTAFCPTVVTNSPDALETSMRAIARACETSALASQRILCIHLEGPFISPFDGPRGAHPREHVREPDWDEFTCLQQAAEGRIGVVTLAPELPGALEFIARACKAGIVVALGHHAASREQIRAAVNAGAVLATHLGNGSHAELPRHNNYIWEQLAHDGLLASIIVDGFHLPPAVVKCFYRAKGLARTILVSDAIVWAGQPAGAYTFMGMTIDIMEDGSVQLRGTPYGAGSTLKLCDAIGNVMDFAGASFADAITMATANPARLLGVHKERGCLRVSERADLTVWRVANGRYTLVKTIAGGDVCFEA